MRRVGRHVPVGVCLVLRLEEGLGILVDIVENIARRRDELVWNRNGGKLSGMPVGARLESLCIYVSRDKYLGR